MSDRLDDDSLDAASLSAISEGKHCGSNIDPSSRAETTDTSGGPSCSTSQWAAKERKAVKRTKYLVVILLAFAAIACGWFTYTIIQKEERKEFEKNFEDNAAMITEISEDRAEVVFNRIRNFATTITSYTEAKNMAWPFVTIPNFEPRGLQTNLILASPLVGIAPLVPKSMKSDWEDYSVDNQGWVKEGVAYRQRVLHLATDQPLDLANVSDIPDSVYQYMETEDSGMIFPFWQIAPAPQDPHLINLDLLSHPNLQPALQDMLRIEQAVLSSVLRSDYFYSEDQFDAVHHPHSVLFQPIYKSLHDKEVVATVVAFTPWQSYLANVLPNGIASIIVVIHNTWGDTFSFNVVGRNATFLGPGSYHDRRYEDQVVTTSFDRFLRGADANLTCAFNMSVYPSRDLEAQYQTNTAVLYTTMVIFVFFCTTVVFFVYDFYVIKQQDKQAAIAIKSNAIISNLFPSKVRKRIMQDAQAQVEKELADKGKGYGLMGNTSKLKNFLYDGSSHQFMPMNQGDTPPIADNYQAATVMFADIAGFTAWSSVRSPEQVFVLLETLYHEFDAIAVRRRVYKVETIGDCYVAAAGVPEPREDHGIVMCRFAKDVQRRMNDLTKRLETELGPDTGDLGLRIGLHSGPLTAGVIRGDKARFQLFGSTVDKAARMESTGLRNRIQVSKQTAELLIKGNKGSWLQARKDKDINGADAEETFWVDMRVRSTPSAKSGESSVALSKSSDESNDQKEQALASDASAGRRHSVCIAGLDDKTKRLVNWICKSLEILLRQVVARRMVNCRKEGPLSASSQTSSIYEPLADGRTVIDEVQEVIALPKKKCRSVLGEWDVQNVELSEATLVQLHDYVSVIASMYKKNPFHSFDHASHVCMSVSKLMSRIVAPDAILDSRVSSEKEMLKNLHDHTHGITSDPLTQFAVVFSALIHDVDHDGVPNAQLVKEKMPLAKLYKNKAVAEQNSIDIAFDLLREDSFQELRATIHATATEQKRFRQLVINSVIATDIADKELKELRNARWHKAFQGSFTEADPDTDRCRKATIVLEHLIQASDVAHTMQHWLMYRKWNERLFAEMVLAFECGRAGKHPAEFWYKKRARFL